VSHTWAVDALQITDICIFYLKLNTAFGHAEKLLKDWEISFIGKDLLVSQNRQNT
jgi:hypothetical protein